jgi:hypothetical protein
MTKNRQSGSSLVLVLVLVLVALVTVGLAAGWYFFMGPGAVSQVAPTSQAPSPQVTPTTVDEAASPENQSDSPIEASSDIQSLEAEVSTMQTDDVSETVTSSDTSGL